MIAYRIADARHPIFDGTGAMLRGGRWNSIGQRVIYAAESYAGAMLEILVHANLGVLRSIIKLSRSRSRTVSRSKRYRRLHCRVRMLRM